MNPFAHKKRDKRHFTNETITKLIKNMPDEFTGMDARQANPGDPQNRIYNMLRQAVNSKVIERVRPGVYRKVNNN